MKLLIFYPCDLLSHKVGGPETFLKGLIKYAPPDIEIEFVGTTAEPAARPAGEWQDAALGQKSFRFFPVFAEKDENRRAPIPVSFRFTLALLGSKLKTDGKVLFFNRLEPAMLFGNHPAKVVVIHNDIENQIKQRGSEVFWSKIPWAYFWFEKKVLRKMSWVYAVSQGTVNFYRKIYPALKERVEFLPTWVDTGLFGPTAEPKEVVRKSLGRAAPSPNGKWVLFVGRFQEQKAPLRLVEAFTLYAQGDPDAKLLMIGEGNMKAQVEEYVLRAGLRQRVFFLGGMPQEKLVKYYQAADVLLLTSNFEGMPMCVLEALGCGLPVVSTDVGEVRSMVKNGFSGEVVLGMAPADIAKALKKVLDAPQVYTRENCLFSVKQFTPEIVMGTVYAKIKALRGSIPPAC